MFLVGTECVVEDGVMSLDSFRDRETAPEDTFRIEMLS